MADFFSQDIKKLRLQSVITANFSVSGNPEIGNTVAIGENPCQIRTQRPKITEGTNFRQHNYPISLIFEIYRSANYRISAFFNNS